MRYVFPIELDFKLINDSELGEWVTIPTVYAGGAKDVNDLILVDRLSNGRVDLAYGR